MHCNHLRSNAFVTLKVEQALAAIGRSETFQRALLMLHDAQIQMAGDANLKRACMAAENVDVATGHGKMLAVLVLGPPGKDRGGSARRGLRWSKSSEQHGQESILGVLRLRATSAVPLDKSVRRSAQDDDFVGILKKNIPNKVALMGLRPGLSSAVPRSTSSGQALRDSFRNH